MKVKKKHDELLAETPEAQRSSSSAEAPVSGEAGGGQSELRDLIAQRAYELYEERGRGDGADMSDWLRAETEVKASLGARNQGGPEMTGRRRSTIPRARVEQ